jgi:serine/threonine protein kinase
MASLPIIPGYELHACLGGGMVTSVYSARDLAADRPCVVKVLRPDWKDNATAVKLLQREARACLAVQHPHLVRLLEAHVTTTPHYLVLQMLSGESLRRKLRREYRLELPLALWVTRQVAEALAALHRAGFIHGDVKPDNIRICDDGAAVLLDLGFAHRPGENASFLQKGYILGTVDYLAPELCAETPDDDFAGDMFSLGVTLFEMLTGKLPYPKGTIGDTVKARRNQPPADIRQQLRVLRGPLGVFMDRLLAPKPEARPRALAIVQHLIELEIAAMGVRHAA